MATVDYQPQFIGSGMPHRKPLPTGAAYTGQQITGNDQMYTRQPAHSHTRTSSSSVLPPNVPYSNMQPNYSQPMPSQQLQQSMQARRSLSNATSSTSSSNVNLARAPTNNSYNSSIRRSTSSRSTTPTSYVALMRKQKATVWCDRAQQEDPRLLAAQRAAKTRAAMEVVGGHNSGRTATSTSSGGIAGGVRSKIRHHGAVKASAYTAANLSGAGVPMRLSASEVDEGDSDEDREISAAAAARYHQRNGSGRSSLGSGHRGVSYISASSGGQVQPGPAGRFSNGSTPPSAASYSPVDEEARSVDPEETPVPDTYASHGDYFEQPGGQGNSGGSGSSEERGFGTVPGLPVRAPEREDPEKTKKTSEELRRRGSVDDRTMTMSGVRLFVANPDLSD